jgi:hypothetical protein
LGISALSFIRHLRLELVDGLQIDIDASFIIACKCSCILSFYEEEGHSYDQIFKDLVAERSKWERNLLKFLEEKLQG